MNGPLVIIGDALLDIDVTGQATRLSPDAPVPVLDDVVEAARAGGAGLAAVMAAQDGHDVVLVTAVGVDEAGHRLEGLLDGVDLVRLPYDGPTPVKQRIRAGGQSLVRLDSGTGSGTIGPLPEGVADVIRGAGSVLVADYGRGTSAVPELRAQLASLPRKVPVTWDPHPRGSQPIPGARLVTPNQAEASLFAQRLGGVDTENVAGLTVLGRQAAALVRAWQAQAVVVTMGERGALLSYGDGAPVMTPAPEVHCVDPCGAGDRFSVTAAVSLGAGSITTDAVQDAVVSAASYVAAGGPWSVPASREPEERDASGAESVVSRVARTGGVVVATGGCFDLLHAGHVATLRAARRLGDCLVVCLNSDASVRRLKGPSRPLVPAADRARVLEALECVDAVVVFDEDTPVEALKRIRPQVWAKGGDYAGCEVPEAAVLDEWGGQAVVLPYLAGRSTTRLVESVAATSENRSRLEKERR